MRWHEKQVSSFSSIQMSYWPSVYILAVMKSHNTDSLVYMQTDRQGQYRSYLCFERCYSSFILRKEETNGWISYNKNKHFHSLLFGLGTRSQYHAKTELLVHTSMVYISVSSLNCNSGKKNESIDKISLLCWLNSNYLVIKAPDQLSRKRPQINTYRNNIETYNNYMPLRVWVFFADNQIMADSNYQIWNLLSISPTPTPPTQLAFGLLKEF